MMTVFSTPSLFLFQKLVSFQNFHLKFFFIEPGIIDWCCFYRRYFFRSTSNAKKTGMKKVDETSVVDEGYCEVVKREGGLVENYKLSEK